MSGMRVLLWPFVVPALLVLPAIVAADGYGSLASSHGAGEATRTARRRRRTDGPTSPAAPITGCDGVALLTVSMRRSVQTIDASLAHAEQGRRGRGSGVRGQAAGAFGTAGKAQEESKPAPLFLEEDELRAARTPAANRTAGGPAEERAGAPGGNGTAVTKEGDGEALGRIAQLSSMFWGVVPLVVVGSVAFELVHRQYAGIDLSRPAELPSNVGAAEGSTSTRVGDFLTGLWPLSQIFFCKGESRRTAQVLLPVILGLTLFSLFLDYVANKWYADFWDSIQNKDLKQFWASMLLFFQLATTKICTVVYRQYIESMLGICWRTALTRRLQEQWLLGRAFYVQGFPRSPESGEPSIDNPDQRLQEDAQLFVTSFMGIATSFLLSSGHLLVFLPVLYALSPAKAFGTFYCPGWLLYMSVAYSLLGSVVTHTVGQMLIPLNFARQRTEANYRHSAVQVRDNAESVALYGSEATEHSRLMQRFVHIQRVVWEQMRYSKYLTFFTAFYSQLGMIFPWLLLAPSFFAGDMTLGNLMQVNSALSHVREASDWFVNMYPDLADLRATADRLWGFALAVDAGSKKVLSATVTRAAPATGDMPALSAKGVRVELPGGRALWEDASLEVQQGERVLLMGPDGCGKSAFLRAIAGCWPASGTASFAGDGALFVPQKPFIPAGTLHAAAAYPEPPEAYGEALVRKALQAVRLDALAAMPLDEEADWQKRLSGGEQQRLALAHAILRRPGVLLLDEATAAVSEAGAAELYAALAEHLPKQTAVVSVDHDANAKVGPTHRVHLVYDAEAHRWVPK